MEYFVLGLKKTLDYKDRSSRKAYWMFACFSWLIALFAMFIDYVFELRYGDYIWDSTFQDYVWFDYYYGPFTLFFTIAMMLPGFTLGIRRLHDINKSGWWLLINMIPLLGALIFFYFMLRAGTYGKNKYGIEPINELDTIDNKSSSTNHSSEMAEELKKFKELLDIGAITEEEYNIKKKEILNL